MTYKFRTSLTDKDVTPEEIFLARRRIIASATAALAASALPSIARAGKYDAKEDVTPEEYATSYNNFIEFGAGKSTPSERAGKLTVKPWSVQIGGLVERPGDYHLEDILKAMRAEERIYRFRCVEAWSMVVPWRGFMLADLLKWAGVKPQAKYVAFETLYRPSEMPGQKSSRVDWPYREGLRLDEAMHPLTLMATGMYGKPLPKQSGAPLRLIVPWKYGFKSIKSVVRITLTEHQPKTTWNELVPEEYGFYANVNPDVSHPRWPQATERRLGGGFFSRRERTRLFNGYADDVARLYEGMDLRKFY